MLGEVEKEKLVSPDKIRKGDEIILTKGTAVEGTALIAREWKGAEALLGKQKLGQCRGLLKSPGISVVREARIASQAAEVHAMHDPTEGGLATGLQELADAAGVGLRVEMDQIPVLPETVLVCEKLKLAPLGLLASGSLLIAVEAKDSGKVIRALGGEGIAGAVIAKVWEKERMTAVTGTNGKTTTTLLLGEMLKKDGKKVGVGGNVGEPLILFANGKDPWEVLVVEISSFQLEAIEDFRPRISVLLNITEDHLDRYPSYNDYIEANVRIFSNQNSGDLAVLNRDDPIVMQFRERVKAKKVFFSLKEKLEEGAFSNGRTISLRLGGKEEKYSLTQTPLKGIHNVENMMAALTAARIFGCSKKAIQEVLNRFEGLEHRLEFVRDIGGVRFYNDSKGTNVGSVVKSLQSFSEPVILIAGGKDKNGDLSPLGEWIQRRVKYLVLIGEAKERMKLELGGPTDTVMAKDLEEGVHLAHQKAKAGEVVLLSPACSSFDMFKDYKERGKVFKEAVKRL